MLLSLSSRLPFAQLCSSCSSGSSKDVPPVAMSTAYPVGNNNAHFIYFYLQESRLLHKTMHHSDEMEACRHIQAITAIP